MPMLSFTADTTRSRFTMAPLAREVPLSVHFSRALAARAHRPGRGFAVHDLEVQEFRELASPVATFGEFRVSAPVCGPHPHAGFSTLSYVFEDSPGSLRSRDSLGN